MAYTSLSRPKKPGASLEARIFPIDAKRATKDRAATLAIPFDFPSGDRLEPALQTQLQEQFNAEIETGLTYPYEDTLTYEGFQAYFLAFDFVLGLFLTLEQAESLSNGQLSASGNNPPTAITVSSDHLAELNVGGCTTSLLSKSSGGRNKAINLSAWDSTYAFSYYIKPNYPGRSSHLCNAGFIVSNQARGLGLGSIAGLSFLYYGPACGYRGSVFNLVYTSNEASVRIWERLGFQKVGIIPGAGRLKIGGTDEYVDAWVVYGDFEKLSKLDMGNGM